MKIIQKSIKVILPLAFGVGIVLFLLNNTDRERLMETVRNGINWSWVLISWGFALLANIARGIRWRQQLQTVGINPSLHEMSVSFFGNYGLNLVFPRFGEFWRCNYIAQGAHRPFFSVGGTILSERMCDILCSLSFVVLAFLLQGKQMFQALAEVEHIAADNHEAEAAESSSPFTWIIVIGLALLFVWFCCKRRGRLMATVKNTLHNLWSGFCTLKFLKNKWSYFGWSLAIWGLYFLNTLTQFYFFDFTTHLGFLACLCVFVMGTVSQILPIQGGLGAWQLLVIAALMVFGIAKDDAYTFAIVAWLLEQFFVLLMGAYALVVVAIARQKNKQEQPPCE